MNSASNDITNRPSEERRTTDITNEVPAANDDFRPERFVLPPVEKNKLWSCIVVAAILSALSLLGIGLLLSALEKANETGGARMQSMNNCKQMVLAVNNIASNMTTDNIPPSYGPFPPGGANQSFFTSLLPYIEQQNLYNNAATSSNKPVKSYIHLGDPNNLGTSGLISYGSNATVLTVGGNPTLPGSFNGRTGGVIVVFERTAKSGATWSSTNSYLIDQNGSSMPEFGSASSWSGFGSRATALNSKGCVVGMADGSSRVVTQSNASAGWSWAMDPNVGGPTPPPGW
jgi:hypothetical protein